jgi:hypothetical protein
MMMLDCNPFSVFSSLSLLIAIKEEVVDYVLLLLRKYYSEDATL